MWIDILTSCLYLMIGAASGVLGALLGIGGGVIIVPSLFFIFSFLGFPKDSLMHMSIGTSLSAMVIGTFASTYFHHRKNNVAWKVMIRLMLGIMIGSYLGIFMAKELSSTVLEKIFGVFACLIGVSFFKPHKVVPEYRKMPGLLGCTLIGMGVASLANLLGLGGGFFMFPIFLYFHFNGQKAAGTSSATSFLISLIGATGYLISSKNASVISGSFGYIYLPAFLLVSLSSLVASFYGVKISHTLSLHRIRQIFALTLVVIGFTMVLIH